MSKNQAYKDALSQIGMLKASNLQFLDLTFSSLTSVGYFLMAEMGLLAQMRKNVLKNLEEMFTSGQLNIPKWIIVQNFFKALLFVYFAQDGDEFYKASMGTKTVPKEVLLKRADDFWAVLRERHSMEEIIEEMTIKLAVFVPDFTSFIQRYEGVSDEAKKKIENELSKPLSNGQRPG